MTTKRTCPECGTALPPGTADWLCPKCLLGQAGAPASDLLPTEAAVRSPDDELTAAAIAPPPRAADLHESGLAPEKAGAAHHVIQSFGDYELLDEIARGGMGIVYRARQKSLNRLVAVKMILAGQFAGKQLIQRFRGEVTAAALLQHPNIVAIHDVGIHEGHHYFSMDYIEGQSLSQLVGNRPLPAQKAAGYVKLIAEAIHYAHQQGILHRDLKPSNVLIDANDQPRITDFGLAKRLDGDASLTVTGQMLGSPNFMPPEQASSERGKVGRCSDVYGLGAILYHLLTARPPFQAESFESLITQVLSAEPVSPRLLNSSVPRDLETICVKCLEREPSRRYQTAQALADELGRFLSDEPIEARPVTRSERAWRWCRRKPVVASLTASSALLLLAVAIGAPIAALRINQERLLTRQSLYSADMRLASQAVHEGAFNHARELLEQHRPRGGADDLRGFEWRYLRQAVKEGEPFRILEGLPAPSGWRETLLSRSERFLYNQSLGQLKAWDMTTWEPVPIVPPPQPASVRWQWDPARGSAYAMDQTQHSLAVYTLPKFESGPTLRLPGPISVVAMSQDRHALAVGFQEGPSHRLLVWDLSHNARMGALGNFEAPISALVFSHDGTLLAASSTNGVVGIWDLKTLEPLPAPPSSASHLGGLEFTPDNKRLLSYNDADLSVWDIGARQAFTLERAGQGELFVFGFFPDAKYIVVSWGGYDLTLLDSRTLLMKGTLRGHHGRIVGIAFSPDGKLLASASVDQTARIWDLATQTEVGIVGGFGERISDVEFSDDGQSIVLIGGFGQVRVFKLSAVLQRGLFAKISGQEGISRLALSPDERRLATISIDGTLALWDRQSRSLIRSASFLRYTQESYANLAFSPDGKRLAWVTGDALRIMLVNSGKISETRIDGNLEVNSVAFSPDGRELVFGCGKQVLIYELVSERQQSFAATDDEVFAVEYSPDGALIAFGKRQGTLTLCERASGRVISKEVKAHPPHVLDVEMSPDGRLLATCGTDASIKLWRVRAGRSALVCDAGRAHGLRGFSGLLAGRHPIGVRVRRSNLENLGPATGYGTGNALRLSRPRRVSGIREGWSHNL